MVNNRTKKELEIKQTLFHRNNMHVNKSYSKSHVSSFILTINALEAAVVGGGVERFFDEKVVLGHFDPVLESRGT
jgi:hypothetical protein